jgi:hypothetical protein
MSGKTNEEGKDSSAEGKDSSTEGKQSVRDPTKARPLHNAAGDGSALNSTTTATTTTTTPTTKTTPKKRDDGKLEHNRVPGGVEDSSSDDEDAAEQFKVILLGDGAVGKTSVAMRFCNDYFSKKYKQSFLFFQTNSTTPEAVDNIFEAALREYIRFNNGTERTLLLNTSRETVISNHYCWCL